MADKPATSRVYNPLTGRVEDIPVESMARAEKVESARKLTPQEAEAYQQHLADEKRSHDTGEMLIAEKVGKLRGIGESFGLPTDVAATSVADFFGKGNEARQYINDLRKYHPGATALGEFSGQVGGGIAGAALTGGLGEAKAASEAPLLARMAKGAVGGSLRGGFENVVTGTTRDVNETALGNADLAGEKLLAQMPKHFAIGAGVGAVAGFFGPALSDAVGALFRKAPDTLERGIDAAIGREVGGGAAEGARVRGLLNGAVPGSRSEIAGAVTARQAAEREGIAAQFAAKSDDLASRQTEAAARLSAEQEGKRLATARERQAFLDMVDGNHAASREMLEKEHAEATEALTKLTAEREAVHTKLGSLASELDKVKGAELPNATTIARNAMADFQAKSANSLTPPSARAQQVLDEWTNTFSQRFMGSESAEKLGFRNLHEAIESVDVMNRRTRVVSGWGDDPDVRRAFEAIRTAAKEEFDRASDFTAKSVSEAKGLSATELRSRLPELDKAVDAAADNVRTAQGAMTEFERGAAMERRLAEREAREGARKFERGVREEDRTFDLAQRNEAKALGKPSKATSVDDLASAIKKAPPRVGVSMGGLGTGLLSLAAGHPVGAVMSIAGSLAASTARAKGNLIAARVMDSMSGLMRRADGQITRIAAEAVGRGARSVADEDEHQPKSKRLKFEVVEKAVRDAQANPGIVEQRVRSTVGAWAQDAPTVYSAILNAAQRQQAFLESKLPASRVDPYSLTAHLEPDEMSPSEKFDFLQYAQATGDPVGAMRDVVRGNGTPQQVEAVAATYPLIYRQAKAELRNELSRLAKPLPYERAVNIGTLLQEDTDTVMTGDFQSAIDDMYRAREQREQISPGSKPRGPNARLSHSMASEGQQIQGGE